MTKTQKELVSRLINRASSGSIKQGWTLTQPVSGQPFLSLQKLNEIQQAHKLAEKYPWAFKTESRAWRLVHLTLLNEVLGRDLVNKIGGIS